MRQRFARREIGTPAARHDRADIIAKLNDAVKKAAVGPEVQDKLGKGMGIAVASSTPAELAARVKVEGPKWAKAVADAGIEKQ